MAKPKRESAVPGDEIPTDKSCCFNDHGVVCRSQGHISATTLGKGPWYCRTHAWVVLGGEKTVPPLVTRDIQQEAAKYCADHGLKTVDQMRAFIKTGMQGMSAKPGNLDWARRIMTRHADSEQMPMISVSKAKEALGLE